MLHIKLELLGKLKFIRLVKQLQMLYLQQGSCKYIFHILTNMFLPVQILKECNFFLYKYTT